MVIPTTELVRSIDLEQCFNLNRSQLPEPMRPISNELAAFGSQSLRGMPFELGMRDAKNIILLDQEPVEIGLNGIKATYLLFAHVVEDRVTNYLDGLADDAVDGNELGQHVSDYELVYADGSTSAVPIHRRFAIQQGRIGWGASPFMAVPAWDNQVHYSLTETVEIRQAANTPIPTEQLLDYGWGETRHASARDANRDHIWLYALPNPFPAKEIDHLRCIPRQERSLIYAISYTTLDAHPLRERTRQKLRVRLPQGVSLNGVHALDDIEIDMGTVISARAALNYDPARWRGDEPNVQPEQDERAVIVEYVAHPRAKLYVGAGANRQMIDLAQITAAAVEIPPAARPVRIRVIDKESRRPIAVRLHLHGPFGEYLPPKGYHRQVNGYWFEDNYGEFVNSHNQYCYILGECVADLPLGEVFIEITRGYEIAPIRTSIVVDAETDDLVFELEQVLNWREKGWISADTHVHFLSPQTALLEGEGEGVNVVNLLASQWGEMFSNVSDFDGRTTFGAKEFGGSGEFLVRVGTENRMQVLGHISLLGYSGAMIHPLCTGGPSESAIGDPLEVTMAEWARRCLDQNGLVIMPHGPNPQCERAADIVLGLVDGIEMMTFNPHDWQISPYGLADWYRYLNLGYHVPVVGGSDKMSASSLLGGVRTYTQMGNRPFTYENWITATRAGNTFVTVGPLVDLNVNDTSPGGKISLPAGGGTVYISWRVESVRVPIEQVELVVGGLVAEQIAGGNRLKLAGDSSITLAESTWIAVRVRGSYKGAPGEIAAHTSAIQVIVGDQPLFTAADASAVLSQIEGAMAYVDTIAARPDVGRFKQLRVTLEGAYNRLHQRMHQQGVFHQHTPIHIHPDRDH